MGNKLDGTYVYRHKHNYIPYNTFTITKVQLHVSAINVGHLQVVHEELINKLYQHVCIPFSNTKRNLAPPPPTTQTVNPLHMLV